MSDLEHLSTCRERLTQIVDDPKRRGKDWAEIKGKRYALVKTRVEVFRMFYGLNYGISTNIISDEPNRVVVQAIIKNENGMTIGSGLAEEFRSGNTKEVNFVSAIENAETSAIGRALASLSLHGAEYASANEMLSIDKQQSIKIEIDLEHKIDAWKNFLDNGKDKSGERFTIKYLDDIMESSKFRNLINNPNLNGDQRKVLDESVENAKNKVMDEDAMGGINQ
jgi:hypothetical protein